MQKNPIFFLPVESTARELDYKLNLARYICKKGWDVIIGNPPFIRDELKYRNYRGVFLEKGMNPNPEYYRALKDIDVYCLSDEGASFPAFSLDYQPAVDSLKQAEKIFLWGESQKQDLISRLNDSKLNAKYTVIGNPGFDFSKPAFKPYHLALKEATLPENYILINTNFGSHNGYTMAETLEACDCSPSTKESMRLSYVFEKERFEKFKHVLCNILESFPNQLFLLRPHPIEIKDNYVKHFGSYSNLIISNKGNVNQAIVNADLIIHNDCTSALQGYLMGVPVISLFNVNSEKALESETITTAWTFAFGAIPQDENKLISLIESVIDDKVFSPLIQKEIDKKANKVLAEMFNTGKDSTEILLNHLEERLLEVKKEFKPYIIKNKRSVKQKIKHFVRSYMPLHYKVSKASRGNLIKISKKDVCQRIALMESLGLTRSNFKVNKIFPNAFYIKKMGT